MKKIRNFKINLRAREILRVIKKLINSSELPVEVEESVQKACYHYSNFIVPSVLYDTFAKGSLSFVYEQDAPEKWIAQSLYFITIGHELQEEIRKKPEAFGEHTCKIASAVAIDALEQAKSFTQRLLASEAKEENCDLSRSIDIPENLYEEASKNIPIDKIDIEIKEGKFIPKYTSCGLFYWIPSKRKSSRK